jgi:hypothetical protein
VRKMILAALVTAPVILAGSARAQGLPQHGHCLTVPSGKNIFVAPGVTFQAPPSTLELFHFNVHEPVQRDLLQGELKPDFTAEPDLIAPFECP